MRMRRYFTQIDDTWPPGLARRLMAMLYDFLLMVALWMVMGFAAVALNDGEANQSPLFHSLLFLATFVFFAFFWMRAGMTLGMQAWRLRVQTPDGMSISLNQSLLRFMTAIVSFAALGLGYWWVLFDIERRAWPDIVSGTRIVVLPKEKKSDRKN